jgi:chromate transporter
VLRRTWEVLVASLQLGLTSFGGPIAHIGYFEHAFVRQRRWLTAGQHASLVSLCQVLPGPASSQYNFLVGLHRAGWPGAFAAWLGFTLPSALLLYAGALLSARATGPMAQAALHGLKLVAVAVVAQAVWTMARKLCPDRITRALAGGAAFLLLNVGGTPAQLAVLALGGVAGLLWCRQSRAEPGVPAMPIRPLVAWVALALFTVLLLGLPLLALQFPRSPVALADVFYRAGALVFGGGHVVLPLLRDALVPAGWIADADFLTGYGLAQAVPGPLFTFAAWLGAAGGFGPSPAQGAVVATLFIFLPGLLIAVAGVPLWSRLARHARAGAALAGINAAVVGILAAALYDPVWITAVRSGADVAIAVAGVLCLERWRVPPAAVVALCVAVSVGLEAFG